MSFKIVIPSHKRAERVSATLLVNNPIICVEESQVGLYKEHNPGYEIVAHPDSVKGLISKRNWMYKHFGELFMLDDDTMNFSKMYIKPGETQKIDDKDLITNIIYNLYDRAKLMGISLYGFTKDTRPEQFNQFRPFSLQNVVSGGAYGVNKSPNVFWNEKLQLKEDFWISGYLKYKERMILVDERYHFHHKDTMTNPGGLSEVRNDKVEMENILLIKKYFGDCVRMKKETFGAKLKKKYNISLRFPF